MSLLWCVFSFLVGAVVSVLSLHRKSVSPSGAIAGFLVLSLSILGGFRYSNPSLPNSCCSPSFFFLRLCATNSSLKIDSPSVYFSHMRFSCLVHLSSPLSISDVFPCSLHVRLYLLSYAILLCLDLCIVIVLME